MAFNSADTAAFKNVWVFCEQRQGVMMPTTFELISEGRKLANELGVELCGILLGDNVDGIATTAARMAHIVLHDEKAIMPASMELCGEYGESGLFAGVPCVIGANGVEEVVELPLTDEEKATFHQCCEGIRHNMEHLKEI